MFTFLLNFNHIQAENKNELSFGLAAGNGVMENVKGMHTPVTGNLGTYIKSLVLELLYSVALLGYKIMPSL